MCKLRCFAWKRTTQMARNRDSQGVFGHLWDLVRRSAPASQAESESRRRRICEAPRATEQAHDQHVARHIPPNYLTALPFTGQSPRDQDRLAWAIPQCGQSASIGSSRAYGRQVPQSKWILAAGEPGCSRSSRFTGSTKSGSATMVPMSGTPPPRNASVMPGGQTPSHRRVRAGRIGARLWAKPQPQPARDAADPRTSDALRSNGPAAAGPADPAALRRA